MTGEAKATVLVVDDEPLNRDLVREELEGEGYAVIEAANGEAALAAASAADLVLLDIMMPGLDGVETCRQLKAAAETADIPVIFMTALSETRDKLAAFEAGGVDYITKPFEPDELLARVGAHVALRRARAALADKNRQLQDEIAARDRATETVRQLNRDIEAELGFEDIIGASVALRAALEQIDQVAPTDASVLILGETGTGKELFARAIHRRSHRADGPMIKLNCAALPRDLVESELFGHEAGAFTGATKARKGRFELADGGTLFLDEVGDLPLEAQGKLLRVLQEGEVERLGGAAPLRVDVRVIAATNADLEAKAQAGAFRDDLFFRLNVFPIVAPPLRERPDDILLLAEHFLSQAAQRFGKDIVGFDSASQAELAAHGWPGNVRELKNLVERAAILTRGALASVGHLAPRASSAVPSSLEDAERNAITAALTEVRWRIEGPGGAAERLGLNPSTLRGRLRKLGIRRNSS